MTTTNPDTHGPGVFNAREDNTRNVIMKHTHIWTAKWIATEKADKMQTWKTEKTQSKWKLDDRHPHSDTEKKRETNETWTWKKTIETKKKTDTNTSRRERGTKNTITKWQERGTKKAITNWQERGTKLPSL